jgi:hypothetical protein
LGDILTKPPIDERLITSSGEVIISKIAGDIGLTNLIEKYTNEKKAHVLRNIIILRTLFNESKMGLVERIPKFFN